MLVVFCHRRTPPSPLFFAPKGTLAMAGAEWQHQSWRDDAIHPIVSWQSLRRLCVWGIPADHQFKSYSKFRQDGTECFIMCFAACKWEFWNVHYLQHVAFGQVGKSLEVENTQWYVSAAHVDSVSKTTLKTAGAWDFDGSKSQVIRFNLRLQAKKYYSMIWMSKLNLFWWQDPCPYFVDSEVTQLFPNQMRAFFPIANQTMIETNAKAHCMWNISGIATIVIPRFFEVHIQPFTS